MKYSESTDNINLIMLSKFGRNDGGTETWFYNFFPALLFNNEKKLTIYGYRTEEDEDNSSMLKQMDVSEKKQLNPVMLLGKKNKVPNFFYMYRSLRRHLIINNPKVPDITIAVGIFELIMMLANKKFKTGLRIVWLRSIFLNEKSERIPKVFVGLSKKFLSFLLKKVDIVLANGDDIRDYYQALGLRVEVIKNGVDAIKWEMPAPKLSGKIRVAYVGRLSQIKGIVPYLQLIQNVQKSTYSDNFEFHIVGDANSYSSEVLDYESRGWLHFHGNIENKELPAFLNTIDVCVALTFSSNDGGGGGTSNALMEQMSASKIIIAWDNAIFRQLLDEKNSYLVEQYSVDGLAMALQDIYANRNLAIQKAIKVKNTILPYTIEAQVKKFNTLVAKTLKKG